MAATCRNNVCGVYAAVFDRFQPLVVSNSVCKPLCHSDEQCTLLQCTSVLWMPCFGGGHDVGLSPFLLVPFLEWLGVV
jgi:hypothetical protein